MTDIGAHRPDRHRRAHGRGSEKFDYTLSPAEAEFDGLTARSETIQLCL
jgi:hypothetical protein